MSKNHVTVLEIFRSFLFAGIFVVTLSGYAAGAESVDDPCIDAIPVELNSSLRGHGDEHGEPFFVRLEVPSAGILSLDVAVSGNAPIEPKLGFADPGCGMPKTNSDSAILERSATHLVLVAQEPGSYLFRVASQDPWLPLRDFRLRTAFAPNAGPSSPFTKGGEDEEEIELEPDPLIHSAGEGRSLRSRLHELCQRGEVDDHGDSLACATFLSPGQNGVGEIRNGWGDDNDVFLFTLGGSPGTSLWTLEIETSGDIDTFGVLYDRSGQRLEKGGHGDRGNNFRIVRTLGPGTYFVRVEGRQGAEGFYALNVDAAPW